MSADPAAVRTDLERLRKKKRLAELREKIEPYGSPAVDEGQYQVGGDAAEQRVSIPETVKQQLADPTKHLYPERSLGELEALVTLGSGMPAATLGPIRGGMTRLNPYAPSAGPESAPEVAKRTTELFTYEPRSEGGQQRLQEIGESMEPVNELYEAGRMHEETEAALEDVDWMPQPVKDALIANAAGIPEFLMAALTAGTYGAGMAKANKKPKIGDLDKYGNVKPSMDKKAVIREQLRKKTGRSDTAKWELKDGVVVTSAKGKEALHQGWDDVTAAGVKDANPATQAKINQMVADARKRLPPYATAKTKTNIRYTDTPGRSLKDRFNFLSQENKKAGQLMQKIASDHKGTVNISKPLLWLKNKLAEKGVEVLPNGKLDFTGSDILKTDRALVNENWRLLQLRTQKPMTFLNAHETKKLMRRSGLAYKETPMKQGASPEVQKLFKGFSGQIDDVLDNISTHYDKQNIIWGKSQGAMDDVIKIARDNMFSESPETALGLLTKRMLGNPTSRQAVINYSKKLDAVARELGGKFDDDLFLQAYVANEMDKVIEIAAGESLKGQAGAQAVAQQIDKSGIGRAAHAYDQFSRFVGGRSEQKALDTLQALTTK